ncbi:hypothetical protein [Occallatibacter riparius]|uniref:Uncharacterized protein n=1 Tax=Occallatibacter riparius TaxID=1002689 RepID=A0A9J7BYK9_9BACT|nr:hypothetical protein [Occallatibacter riparius]UWZ86565.1 hypothetical protein MOP44_11610 [Occallatibacter riparius]
MKRLAQFVVLFAAVLMVAQPALGYLSCSLGACSGSTCPAACCGDMPDMPGMIHGASMHSGMSCSSMMEALPANSGCGQPLPSTVVITREALIAGQHTLEDGIPVFVSLPAFTPPVSTRAGSVSLHPAFGDRAPVDRGVLFQVFRI